MQEQEKISQINCTKSYLISYSNPFSLSEYYLEILMSIVAPTIFGCQLLQQAFRKSSMFREK